MKKILVNFILLVSLGFSTLHSYVFAAYDTNHCSASEYVQELQAPSEHNDICDIHFEYHQSYILSADTPLISNHTNPFVLDLFKDDYTFKTELKFIKPPIT